MVRQSIAGSNLSEQSNGKSASGALCIDQMIASYLNLSLCLVQLVKYFISNVGILP